MDTYLSKSWQTVHGMIDAFFILLPKIILAIVVFVLFWLLGIVVNRLVGYISPKIPEGSKSQHCSGACFARGRYCLGPARVIDDRCSHS